MVKVEHKGIILESTGLEFENQAVLNPACILKDGVTHMFYRAVRQGNYSSIGYCQIQDGKVKSRLDRPLLFPEYHFERHGVEDPRVVELDGIYYMFYTGYDGVNVHAAFATSKDMVHWTKQGLISPTITYRQAIEILRDQGLLERYYWYEKHYEEVKGSNVLLFEKDVFMFPKKYGGKFLLIHRIMPGIQIMPVDNLKQLTQNFWTNYLTRMKQHILLDPKYWFESRKLGGGCPPIETRDGWLLIYHAVEDSPGGNIYRAAAALLDLENPAKVIGRLPEPLFAPVLPEEVSGDVPNVVFPTGAVLEGGQVNIYYGAADKRIMQKTVNLEELLAELKNNPQG